MLLLDLLNLNPFYLLFYFLFFGGGVSGSDYNASDDDEFLSEADVGNHVGKAHAFDLGFWGCVGNKTQT